MTTHSSPNSEPFDDTTKDFYRHWFEQLGLTVETQREIFFRGRAIDLVVGCPTLKQQQSLETTLFSYFKRLNAIEFKGIHDPLTMLDYNKIMMRIWGLGAMQTEFPNVLSAQHDPLNQLPSQRTLTIVCVTKPDNILRLSNEFQFYPTSTPGIYHCPARIAQWIIHPTELELAPLNYPLLPLARGKKLAEFIQLCLKQGLLNYILLTLRIGLLTDPLTIWQKIWEIQRMELQESDVHEAVIPYIERYFQTYPEELKRLSITSALLNEQLQKGLQEGIQQGVQQGIQQQTKKLLWQQVRLKFPTVAESVRERIEATSDLEQLETWLTQVLTANSLAEVGLE